MRGQRRVRVWVYVCLAAATVAVGAAPARADDPQAAIAKQKEAASLLAQGEYAEALAVIDEGLQLAPERLQLLELKASTLLELRDFEGALAAYEAFLAAKPKGANKRAAQRIVNNLAPVRTTAIDLTVTGATADQPASVYLDTKSLGVFCVAAPTCHRGIMPGDYKIIVERPGHKKSSERVSITKGQTLTLERTLVENPSPLTVAVAGGDGVAVTVTLDGKPLDAPPQALAVDAGDHTLEVAAPGHATERQSFAAHLGAPVELAVTLRPLLAVAINVADAEVLLDDAPVARQDDALVIPAGAVTLTVRAPGYVTQQVEVPAERPAGYRLDVTLAPAPAPLTIDGAPAGATVAVDGHVAARLPLVEPLMLAQGDHTIEVRAAHRASFRTEVQVDRDAPLHLEVATMPSTRRTWTWVAAAGTGAALVSWGAFGALALQRSSSFDDRAVEAGVTPTDATLRSLSDQGHAYAVVSDVSLVLTLAGAGAATWLYLHEGRGASRGEITAVVAPGAVGVQGTF
ncbi:MAG: PEGA domain-containing protein [Kofleriaceae bacterium]|nr:PEGA domain-containing protein [Myxococcales bacterium]MCB9572935.1 PEGA domain-containing protein [Kofleriaceae bacterium]